MKTSEQINEIATAMAKCQGEVQGAHRSSDNPFFKSKYADLASVWDACREPLAKNNLAVVQFPATEILEYDGTDDKGNPFKGTYAKVSVTTRLIHSSGQWVEGTVVAEAKDAGPQAIGSAITYLRRYALQSVVGVAPEDDDGNAASPQVQRSHQPSKSSPRSSGKPEPSATPEYAAFEGYLKSTANSNEMAVSDAWKAIKPECERLGLGTAAAIKGCNDLEKFNQLKKALEESLSVHF